MSDSTYQLNGDRRHGSISATIRTALHRRNATGTVQTVEWLQAQGVSSEVIARVLSPGAQVRKSDLDSPGGAVE